MLVQGKSVHPDGDGSGHSMPAEVESIKKFVKGSTALW
jgi:hypothetical protein